MIAQRFASATAAREAIARARAQLHGRRDADHPPAILHCATASAARPLILIGGMGPLAGLEAMQEALLANRHVVLVQACGTPDRTAAIESGDAEPVVAAIAEAVALGIATLGHASADVIVVCNTAHVFLDAVRRRVVRPELQWISLIEAAADAAARRGAVEAMALCTRGCRKTRLFPAALEARGIAARDLDERAEELLMRAIYDGVKAGNDAVAVTAGERLVRGLADAPLMLIAGCTEVPRVLQLVREHGSATARAFLAIHEIIDPIAVALGNPSGGEPWNRSSTSSSGRDASAARIGF